MRVETIATPGLAHRSYLIVVGDQAVVVDPRYEPDTYVAAARASGARLAAVLETHRNEDYVSGGYALSERTGAAVLHGRHLAWSYGQEADEGTVLELDSLSVRVLETPGHTRESLTFVLIDRSTGTDAVAAFTGDTLFVGDVGRTDLMSDRPEEAAAILYDSLHGKILPLGDHVVLYPAHGAGSVCGRSMAERAVSTIGYERRNNPLLQLERVAFVRRKAGERHHRPPYFRQMERINLEGAPDSGSREPLGALSASDVDALSHGGALLVDVREPAAIAGALIPGALGLPLSVLLTQGGWFLPYDRDLVLVAASEDQARAAWRQLAWIGIDRVVGWMDGMMGWATAGLDYVHLPTVSGPALRSLVGDRKARLLDVRSVEEWEEGHLAGAEHLPLDELPAHLDALPRDRPLVVLCGTGVRSTVAATLLVRAGFRKVALALGSMKACRAIGCPVVLPAAEEPV